MMNMKNSLVKCVAAFILAICVSSCSTIEWQYDDVLDGINDVCEDLDYILDDDYTNIINDYADNITKYEKDAEAEYSEFFDQLTITFPYNYIASGVVSGLLGGVGDLLVMAGDEVIRSKSKPDLIDKIKKNLNTSIALVYISLVQKEGSIVYCYETSGFADKEIELTTKNLESILAQVDYDRFISSSSAEDSRDYTYATIPPDGSRNTTPEIVRLVGKVGGKYPIEMELDVADFSDITGRYRYTSSGSGAWLTLRGNWYKQYISLKEYNEKGECCGSWDGQCFEAEGVGWTFSGTMTNYAGKTFHTELEQQ